jgi:hypothetical protein
MQEINSTNIVPFFIKRELAGGQMLTCHCCEGIAAPLTNFVPLQFISSVDVSNDYFELLDYNGILLGAIPDTFVEKKSLNGGSLFSYTYKGIGFSPAAGLYQIRLRTTLIASEVIKVCNVPYSYLEFWNTTDLCGVQYQTGFKQRLYFKSYEDYPIFDITDEKIRNGDSIEISTISTQINKRKIVFLGLFPSQFSAFKRIAMHDNIVLFDSNSSTSFAIKGGLEYHNLETEIEPLPCLSKASFIFDTDTCVKTACNRNEFVI